MKKNRTMLSFGLIVSTIISICYLVGNIKEMKENGFSELSLFIIIVASLLIIVNTSAFITTDKNNEEFREVKWRSWLAFGLFILLYITILVLFIVKAYEQKYIAAAVLFISTATIFLLLLGINTRTISSYEEKNQKE